MIGRTIYLTCLYIFVFLMSSKQQSGKGTVFSQKSMTTLHMKNSFRLPVLRSKIKRSWINFFLPEKVHFQFLLFVQFMPYFVFFYDQR